MTILIGSGIQAERNYARDCGALRMPCGDAGSKLRGRMSTRLVIAGGGVAALEALLALQADAGDLVDVTLVADSDAFSYRALQLGRSSPERYPLATLVEGVGARFVRGSVASIGAGARELVLDG